MRSPVRPARPVRWIGAIVLLVLSVLAVLLLPQQHTSARGDPPAGAKGQIAEVAAAELPPEARHTLALISKGGPFPYDRDGIVFNNREKLLPLRERGWYREYTVVTPGVRHRGARRIVAARSGEFYYTDDHYASFRRIRQ